MLRPSSVVGLALMLTFPVATTHAAPGVETRADRDAVAELMFCYARGTDEIGDATTNPDPLAS